MPSAAKTAFGALLARIPPQVLFVLADRLGRFLFPFHSDRSQKEFAHFFAYQKNVDLRKIVRENYATYYRNMALRYLVRTAGIDCIKPVLTTSGMEELIRRMRKKTPAILTVSHIGVPAALFAALDAMKIPAMVIRFRDKGWLPARFEVCSTEGGPGKKASAFKRAIKCLGCGGFVIFAIDEWEGEGGPMASFLGRQMTFRRGIAAASRITGSDIIPISSLWEGNQGRIRISVHPPLNQERGDSKTWQEFEYRLMQQTVSWLEKQIRDCPFQITPVHLKRYQRAFAKLSGSFLRNA